MEAGEEGRIQFGPKPNTIPETHMAPELGEQPPLKEAGAQLPPVVPVHPGALDNLMWALQGASIMDEHRVLMGVVIEKVQAGESGLNESCISLIKGLDVHL